MLWSSGFRKLSPLSPLLVKGRNLYKQKTYRQVGINLFMQAFLFFPHPQDVNFVTFYCSSCFRDGKMKLIELKCFLKSTDVVQQRGLLEQ